MIRGALLATAAAGAFFEGEPDLTTYTYAKYVEQFGKHAEGFREALFHENIKLMQMQNADPHKTWVAAPNQFTDWTEDERKILRAGNLPPGQFNVVTQTNVKLSDLPTRVDWRDRKGVVTPVKNQEACGSCWAFSATATFESHYALATNEDAPILAPQQLVSCAPNPNHCGGKGGCQGSTADLAFNYTQTIGVTLEANYPYKAETLTCDASKIKPVAINSGFVSLKTNDYQQLVFAVAMHGPVSINVDASSSAWSYYHGGIFSGDSCGFDIDHVVQLVGYGEEESMMYWLVRNSWSANWGEKGYMRIRRMGEGNEPCGQDPTPQDGVACAGDTSKPTYCGLCGIMSASSYPMNVRKIASIQI